MKHAKQILLIIATLYTTFHTNAQLPAQTLEQDSLALVALYDSTGGEYWTNNTNWLTGPVASWSGITISEGRVTKIYLSNNNLAGTIPLEIGGLNQLTDCILNGNQLSGPLPPEIGNLTELEYLYLQYNDLTGTIPPEIGNLTKLIRFFGGANQLSGAIPPEIGNMASLVELFLDINQLEGAVPPEIGNLASLTDLHLANNQLTDSIPAEIGNLVHLDWLTLHNNQLSGAIPITFQNLESLVNCSLFNNRFTDLPDLSSITTLINLDVRDNQLTFEDIESNITVPNFQYAPQDSVGAAKDTTVAQGTILILSVSVGGRANEYQWAKDGTDIPGANADSYSRNSVTHSDSGAYTCRITNPSVPELTLYSRPVCVHVSGEVGVSDRTTDIPQTFVLHQNYPNPFNPETTIRFGVKRPCQVVLKVYNLLGQEVVNLVDEKYQAGQYEVTFDASRFSSGIYFYRIQMKDFHAVRKMVVLE